MAHPVTAFRDSILSGVYHGILRPIFFSFDSEKIHNRFIHIGSIIGSSSIGRAGTHALFGYKDARLEQDILGIHFTNPIGLAAGFDYEGRLTGIMKSVGMGLSTVGTITNLPYEGNQRPMLGRLVKSKSLLVNKGFKNLGMHATLEYVRSTLERVNGKSGGKFLLPVGLSIGKTNTLAHQTQEDGVADVCAAFAEAERAGLSFSYYELNISCPNLKGTIEFYEPAHLRQLLDGVFALKPSKPVFIKMPITETDEETVAMLEVISHSPAAGVIFGNLQNDRNDPAVVPEESAKYPKGNLSGMPTQKRSDELIKLAYKKYGERFIIIGCGGVFSAEDAYRKICLGASLIQMITGMIFEGPQVVGEINRGLGDLLARDGFANISQAIGADI